MPTIAVNDQQLFYTDNRVQNNQAPLILIHGAGGTHLHWPSELRMMEGRPVYTLDLPDHGESEGPGHNSIEGYADVIENFVSAMGLSNAILVGHSMGGAIAQIIGVRNPGWLAGLVLVGTSARLRVTDVILDGLLENFSKTVSFIMRMCWSGPVIPAVRIALAGREMRLISAETVHGDFYACSLFDIRTELGDIKVPTLVLCASDDKMTPLKFGQALAESIPDARIAVIKEAGHMMALEYPLQVTAEIQQFVEGCLA